MARVTSLTSSPGAARLTSGRRSPGAGDDDAALVAAVRRGDDAAFARLYERYRRRIATYAYRHVRDHGRAEDVTQEVFLSALRRMRGTSQPIIVQPWLYEIARNACIDHHRRSRGASEVSYDGCETTIAAPQPTPPAAVDAKTRLDDLRHAFGSLSALERELVVLRELEGLSLREIGERLHLGRREVQHGLARAHAHLSDEYDDLSSGMRCVRVQSLITAAGTRALGSRERVRVGSHVLHCGACRVQARRAGLRLEPGTIPRRLAALLPVPVGVRRIVWTLRRSLPGAAGPVGGLATSASLPDWPAWTAVGAALASVGIALGAGLGVGAWHTRSGAAGRGPGGRELRARGVPEPAAAGVMALGVRSRGIRIPLPAAAGHGRRAPAPSGPHDLGSLSGRQPMRAAGPAGPAPSASRSPGSPAPTTDRPAPAAVRPSAANGGSGAGVSEPHAADRGARGGGASASAPGAGAAPVAAAGGGAATTAPPVRAVGTDVVAAAGQVATSSGGAVTGVGSAVTQVGSAAGSAVRSGATTTAGAVQSLTGSTPATAPVGQAVAPVVNATGTAAGNTVAAAGGAAGSAVAGVGTVVSGVGTAVSDAGQTATGLLDSAPR